MAKIMRSSWFVASLAFVDTTGVAISSWVGGAHGKSLQVFGLGVVIALFLLAAGRSKRLRKQFYDTDERTDAIGMFAATWSGFTLFFVLFVAFLVENARGHSVFPYFWLAALYIGLLGLFRLIQRVRR